ncbi:MAG: ATP-dependent DNA helicase RecG [Oscillospiraceae bacterium]|nr:ATP-dependent DNA helicase RecG [Oscillospiraceae bacterium]
MRELDADVRYLRGVGEQRARALAKLGITDLKSLISCFPRAYDDRTAMRTIASLEAGETACVRAMVAQPPTLHRVRRGLELVKVRVVDATGSLYLTFFNQAYIRDALHHGETYTFYGKAEINGTQRQMANPVFEREDAAQVTGRIVPIYPLTAGLGQSFLLRTVRQGLDDCMGALTDPLPDELRQAHNLCHIGFAYENIHFPDSFESLSIARRRFVFEELFILSLALRLVRAHRAEVTPPRCGAVDMSPFYAALPFSLTGAQSRCVEEILRDMCAARPMNRLCQGDVGSGKTMVAAAAIYFAVRNGHQAALMAPTEILAAQHHTSLAPLFDTLGIRCALLTGSMRAPQKRKLLADLAAGEIDVLIGTHALISEQVSYRALGLVVTDEQHRFGVQQRAALWQKGAHPHILVMSATPIPRTLALIIYGDLDVSVLDELPPGRQSISTYAVPTSYRPRIYAFLKKQIKDGRQGYIICPMVEENDELPDERKAVTAYAEQLSGEVFPDLHVAALHGRMKSAEKERIMRAFAGGEIDILVSTTVVEVGVDVPNATVILIENAERFGLSQLHQLRGRVGRGQHSSHCILVSDNDSPECRARLEAMCKTRDGFKLAEEDLRLRGPGDFFGARQHGLPALKVADLSCDMQLLTEATRAAEDILARDAALSKYDTLRTRIAELFAAQQGALN